MAVTYSSEFNSASGTGPSVPAGSNRVLLAFCAEGYIDGFSKYTGFEYGGVSTTAAADEIYQDRPQAQNHGLQVWRMDETQIASMSGSAFSFTGGTHGSREVITFVWLTDVDQTALEKDQGGNNATSLTLNTDIASGDIVIEAISIRPNGGGTASISFTTAGVNVGFPSGGDDGADADATSLASVVMGIADHEASGSSIAMTSSLTNVDVGCHFAVAYEPAAAGDTTRSLSDGIEVGDSVAAPYQIDDSASDGLDLGDTVTYESNQIASPSDGLSLGDSPTGSRQISDNATDGLALGEDMTIGHEVSFTDEGIVLGDDPDGVLDQGTSITDGLDLGDSAVGQSNRLATASDGLVVGESVATGTEADRAVLDGLSLGELIALYLAYGEVVTDGLVMGDGARYPISREHIRRTIRARVISMTRVP